MTALMNRTANLKQVSMNIAAWFSLINDLVDNGLRSFARYNIDHMKSGENFIAFSGLRDVTSRDVECLVICDSLRWKFLKHEDVWIHAESMDNPCCTKNGPLENVWEISCTSHDWVIYPLCLLPQTTKPSLPPQKPIKYCFEALQSRCFTLRWRTPLEHGAETYDVVARAGVLEIPKFFWWAWYSFFPYSCHISRTFCALSLG